MAKPACGQHTELATNDAVRITRCGCGTVHVTVHASGVTMRLSPENARNLMQGLRAAFDRPEAPTQLGSTSIN